MVVEEVLWPVSRGGSLFLLKVVEATVTYRSAFCFPTGLVNGST